MTEEQARMENAVRYLNEYMQTYAKQYGYQNYQDRTLIDDVLYGLGVALDRKEYQFADGFQRFKERLQRHLAGKP